MPERPLTVAAYAAGASLAAITLVYVFGPTFFFDDDAANSSKSSRKRGVVGLSNPANDCFINSVLQALAGLPELRLYLIREVHRRKLDGPELYKDLAAAVEEQQKSQNSNPLPEWKVLGLQQGLVTIGLKDVLDALNERPIYRKTISAQSFIYAVEQSFRTRISRSQQDAQEFLQIIAERLDEENHAGRGVRRRARRKKDGESGEDALDETAQTLDGTDAPARSVLDIDSTSSTTPRDSKLEVDETSEGAKESEANNLAEIDVDDGQFTFPFEGKLESQVECSYCNFKPKPHISSFVTLTLHVAQSSGSLNSCFDGMFKQEHIDDFTCDRCRLEHALQIKDKQLSKTSLSEDERARMEDDRAKIEEALHEDPETPPKGVKLPDLATAPKRRISRHMRISDFPRILSLHLNRSVWDAAYSSSKNTAKVAFPEILSLGSLLDRKTYRLLAVITHKGGHNSGHYETFRRQFLNAPYSTPASMGTEGIYSVRSSPAPSPQASAAPSPHLASTKAANGSSLSRPISTASLEPPSTATTTSSSSSASSSQSTVLDRRKGRPAAAPGIPLEAMPTPGLPPPPQDRQQTDGAGGGNSGRPRSSLSSMAHRMGGRRKGPDRWWRISDDKIRECKSSEVFGMQREVYLLFYELVQHDLG